MQDCPPPCPPLRSSGVDKKIFSGASRTICPPWAKCCIRHWLHMFKNFANFCPFLGHRVEHVTRSEKNTGNRLLRLQVNAPALKLEFFVRAFFIYFFIFYCGRGSTFPPWCGAPLPKTTLIFAITFRAPIRIFKVFLSGRGSTFPPWCGAPLPKTTYFFPYIIHHYDPLYCIRSYLFQLTCFQRIDIC